MAVRKLRSVSKDPRTIEEVIAERINRGERVTDWQRYAMAAWEQRGVRALHDGKGNKNPKGLTYAQLGLFPIPCNCAKCGEGALIFPGEEGAEMGYCICPRCSFRGADAQAVERS